MNLKKKSSISLCVCVSVCAAQFKCPEDSQCVDYYKVCDQHPDCPEATDEMNCTEGNKLTPTSKHIFTRTVAPQPLAAGSLRNSRALSDSNVLFGLGLCSTGTFCFCSDERDYIRKSAKSCTRTTEIRQDKAFMSVCVRVQVCSAQT